MKKEAKEELKAIKLQAKEEKKRIREERKREKQEEKEKYPSVFLRRKARRIRWKQEKQRRRQALIRRYKDAPWFIRIPRLYLIRPFIALAIIALLVTGIVTVMPTLGLEFIEASKNTPVDQKEIQKLSPLDKEGAKRIDALPPVDGKDTWTICVYLVGSNLEDMGENDLSDAVMAQISDARQKRKENSAAKAAKRINSFTGELKSNDLDIPSYLYYPRTPDPSNEETPTGEVIATEDGAASVDIGEMTSDVWSDNIRIVIQTGGSTRWSNPMVNPNRTQRFLYYKGEFSEVYDEPLQQASDPGTLTSFLNFCKKEYPADHNMLILWNHGGASFGYGHDSVYGDMMSLKDIRTALEGAYGAAPKKPPLDILGYDACLMSSLEVTHAMRGYASYYAVSEETEPGDGWDYAPWLKAMTKDPTMSPAKVAQHIADSYMDFYMTQNVNTGWFFSSAVTFSVLDAKKAEELYQAYCALTKKQLIDATKDRSIIAEIGRCSNKSTHFVASDYNLYNTIDLGNYADNMVDTYPEESSRIRKLVGETVLYHRENGALSDAKGISVYLPGSVDDFEGLMMCLQYVYEICDDPATRALYYYKVAGCLNEDMQKYLATITDGELTSINLKPFEAFARTRPVTTEEGFEIPVDEKLQSMLQSYELEIALFDAKEGVVKNYGRDELVRLDGEGNMDCEFDGKWICLDGEPLATEVASSTESTVEYRSKVLYNGRTAYLYFGWDRDSEEFTINGIRGATTEEGVINTIYMPDPVNYLVNTRMNTKLKKGDVITPIYETSHIVTKKKDKDKDKYTDKDKEKDSEQGKDIKVGKNTSIELKGLPGGYYLGTAVIGDSRGDVYYSQVVGNKVSGGKVKGRKVESNFMGRDY